MPLTDLGSGAYLGEEGGLYPGGANARPAAHESAGLAIAAQVQPLDGAGNPDAANGRIVLASMGMSNTTQEFSEFLPLAAADAELDPRVTFVDGAQGGQTAQNWADPAHACWATFATRLANAGVTGAQLQAVWMKLASPASSYPATFPAGPRQVQAWIRQAVLNLKSKYPSVRIVYLSSRIYAGYASTNLNPEPQAYENAFSVKWLVQDQINGDPGLAHGGASPPAPWLSWGPYLWADGLGPDGVAGGVPGRSDGLEWLCSDLSNDGTHPSTTGRQKVAQMLLAWLKTDSTSMPWILANPPAPADSDGDGLPDAWELQYWPDLSQAAGGDPDGDSSTNLQEYHAGTNPTQPPAPGGAGSSREGSEGCGATGLEALLVAGFAALLRRGRGSYPRR